MVSAISQLGHALHLQLVAEGIEQPEQAATLRGAGLPVRPGLLFARPLPADALGALLDQAGRRSRGGTSVPHRPTGSPRPSSAADQRFIPGFECSVRLEDRYPAADSGAPASTSGELP